jgi:hypothetical protein
VEGRYNQHPYTMFIVLSFIISFLNPRESQKDGLQYAWVVVNRSIKLAISNATYSIL